MTPETDTKFRLSPGQVIDPLWLKVKEHIEQEISRLRKENDNPALGPEKTALIRGQIKSLQNMMLLEDRPPVPDGQFIGHG